MPNYNLENNYKALLQPDIVSLLLTIREYKGEQNLFIEAQSDTLAKLVEVAKIQSTEASNKIEGIYTANERLQELMAEKTAPKTRSEQEIAGYRDVLNTIHESHDYIPIKPSILLQLHRDLYKFSASIGGTFKAVDNQIAEIDSQGNKKLRFQPVAAWETAENIETLCASFNSALQNSQLDPLLLIPMFILDFLCIHPFQDGNGRMSRLLTLLLLYRAGYIVGKYISIEKLIEQSKETYYESLKASSVGWHDGQNDYAPFVRYMLGVIVAAYKEFASRVKILTVSNLTKVERLEAVIKAHLGPITKAELVKKCPYISQTTIQRTLAELLKANKIHKLGGGRYTAYVWCHN